MEIQPISFKNAFKVVAGLHVVVLAGIMISSSASKSYAKEDKTFIATPEAKYTGIEPTPIPAPEPIPIPVSEPIPNKNKGKYTQTYTIKKGDTINSISKKFHLNTKRLIELNNIKDPNKISVGQVLKFI
jgi:LysM repeat protein